jgi:hypothetical protein
MRVVIIAMLLSATLAAPADACAIKGTYPALPPLAKTLDAVLAKAELAPADLERVKQLRAEIEQLAAAGNEREARKREEEAMRILGYTKAYLRCGPGSFAWRKRSTPTM